MTLQARPGKRRRGRDGPPRMTLKLWDRSLDILFRDLRLCRQGFERCRWHAAHDPDSRPRSWWLMRADEYLTYWRFNLDELRRMPFVSELR